MTNFSTSAASFTTDNSHTSTPNPQMDNSSLTMQLDDPQARQRVFALRFRTELCRTHMTTGRCEYRDKCMFAHGNKELRTEEMNEEEGLESDKAIRAWIRERRRTARQRRTQKYTPVKPHASALSGKPLIRPAQPIVSTTFTPMPVHANVRVMPIVSVGVPVPPAPRSAPAINDSPATAPSAASTPSTTSLEASFVEGLGATAATARTNQRYRHNPYSLFRVQVLQQH